MIIVHSGDMGSSIRDTTMRDWDGKESLDRRKVALDKLYSEKMMGQGFQNRLKPN